VREKDDKEVELLERSMRGDKKRTVIQDRITAMMGDYQRSRWAEKAEEDKNRRLQEARAREEALASSASPPQSDGHDGPREDSVDSALGDDLPGDADPA